MRPAQFKKQLAIEVSKVVGTCSDSKLEYAGYVEIQACVQVIYWTAMEQRTPGICIRSHHFRQRRLLLRLKAAAEIVLRTGTSSRQVATRCEGGRNPEPLEGTPGPDRD
jgi:hypothetical protein